MKLNCKRIASGLLMTSMLNASNALENRNAIFYEQKGELEIPFVEINGKVKFVNVKMKIEPNGGFKLISADYPTTGVINEINFPLISNVILNNNWLGGIFQLSDGSMWEIKGVASSDGFGIGTGVKSVTIFQGASSLRNPGYGEKSDYFMLVEGNGSTYFVQPLIDYRRYLSGNVNFNNNWLGSIFQLSDGSMWEIKGVASSDGFGVGTGVKNVTIFQGTSSLRKPSYGEKGDYFMLTEGNGSTYFVQRIQ